MKAPQDSKVDRRFRLAGNDNETIVVDRHDRRRFRIAGNANETIVVDDDLDTGSVPPSDLADEAA